jgi:hypothetical protein
MHCCCPLTSEQENKQPTGVALHGFTVESGIWEFGDIRVLRWFLTNVVFQPTSKTGVVISEQLWQSDDRHCNALRRSCSSR